MKRPKNTVLPPCFSISSLGARQHPLRVPLQPAPALEQPSAAPAADDPVAEVVADDRRRGRDGDHLGDVVVPLRGEDAEEDERRLARERDAERLDHHDQEKERQPVLGDEVRHARSRRRRRRMQTGDPGQDGDDRADADRGIVDDRLADVVRGDTDRDRPASRSPRPSRAGIARPPTAVSPAIQPRRRP